MLISSFQNLSSLFLKVLVVGNATRVPENPGNPPVFKPINPGLCAGKNSGLTGLISGVSQYSVHWAEKRAETKNTKYAAKYLKQLKHVTLNWIAILR